MTIKSDSIIKKNKILLITIIFTIGLIGVMLFTPGNNLKLQFDEIYELDDSWTVEEISGEIYTIDLPENINIEKGQLVHLSKVLPASFKYGKTLRIRSSMQNVQVNLDGNTIYDNSFIKRKIFPYTPEASAWILVDIPIGSENSVIDIFISSDIKIMSGRLNGIYYGSRGDLIGALIKSNSMGIGVVLLGLSVALFALLASLTVELRHISRLNYLGIFSFAIALWLLSEMDIMQIFFSNNYLVGTISYLMLPIATFTFTLYIYEVALKSYKKIIYSFVLIEVLYLMISIILQVFLGVDYIIFWPIFMVILAINISTILVLLVIETNKKSKVAVKYLLYILVLFVTVIIETVLFLIGKFNNVSSLSSIGIVFFILLVILDTIKYLSHSIQKETEANYLRDVAYNDPLTKGLNRAAFERDIDQLLIARVKSPFRLSMFDMNELKKINDVYGHEVGDEALKTFYKALVNAFGQDTSCYRVGGDEFMVIHLNISDELFNHSLEELQSELKQGENKSGYVLEAAYGSEIYMFEESFGEFKHIVDMKMYKEKSRQKLQINNNKVD